MNTTELPADIREWVDSIPTLTKSDLEELRRTGEALDKDPAFRAEFIKGRFVSEMLAAMDEAGKSQAEVARAWGKTRQYLNKVLNEDRRVNFTVETLCELAHLLNRRIDLQVLREDEVSHVLRIVSVGHEIESLGAHWAGPATRRQPLDDVAMLFGNGHPNNQPISITPNEVPELVA